MIMQGRFAVWLSAVHHRVFNEAAIRPDDRDRALMYLPRTYLKSDPNQRSSGHPRIATTRSATIGVPIATMTARIACQWVRSNQSTTQSLRTNSGDLAMFAAILRA